MEEDSGFKLKFDSTINVSVIIGFIMFISSGFAFFNSFDKRMTLLEANQKTQTERDNGQDRERRLMQKHTKEAFDDLKKQLNRIEDYIRQ